MMPNMDPRSLKRMMDSMGMKTMEIPALRVIIEGKNKSFIIDEPNVTMIEMQGNKSFQITGRISEAERDLPPPEITEDDISMVKEKTGATEEAVKKALEETNGNIAEAIMKLNGNPS